MDANDELDARAWVSAWRGGRSSSAPDGSQLWLRAWRFEDRTLELLSEGDVAAAMRRLDRLVELTRDDEGARAMVGVGPVESIFHTDLDSAEVARELERRWDRPGWDTVLLAAVPAWAPDRLHLPAVRLEPAEPTARRPTRDARARRRDRSRRP